MVFAFSVIWFRVILPGEKLQAILNGSERSGTAHTHGLLLLCGSDDRVLGPGRLVDVVDPGIDAPAVLTLCNGIGDIAPVVFAPVGQGELRKHIRVGLLSPENGVLGIGLLSQKTSSRSRSSERIGVIT